MKNMKGFKFVLAAMLLLSVSVENAVASDQEVQCLTTQWNGMRVGVLGDSMSAPTDKPEKKRFYSYLAEMMGIEPAVYAVSGFQWKDLAGLARKMRAEQGDDIDAILIWAGTNDYNASRPIGEFFTEKTEEVNVNGKMVSRKHRTPVMADSTFCGSINMVMSYLKENYPTQQIIILTPVHRAFAKFGDNNIQPDELYANGCGLYIDDYVAALKRAGEVWSVPVIDLFSISGYYPLFDSFSRYVQNPVTDRLHPDRNGHRRLALTLFYQLQTLPATFR